MNVLPLILLSGLALLASSSLLSDTPAAPTTPTHDELVSAEVITLNPTPNDQPVHGADLKSGKVEFIVAPLNKDSPLFTEGRVELRAPDGLLYTTITEDDLDQMDTNHDGTINKDEEAAANVALYPAWFLSPLNNKGDLTLNVNKIDPITQIIYNGLTGNVLAKEADGHVLQGKRLDLYFKGKVD